MLTESLVKGVLGLFFPADCVLCKNPLEPLNRSYICFSCWEKVEWVEGNCCIICGKPMPSFYPKSLIFPDICSACRLNPPNFKRLFSPTFYRGVMAEAIKIFKYQGKRGIIRGFTFIIETFLEKSGIASLGVEAVIPVPLHPRKLRERGFNQAEDIARVISRCLDLSLLNDFLIRVRYTKSQTTLKRKEREENLKGAFSVKRKIKNRIPDKVLLVDDVYTTGVTLNEAAGQIKKEGIQVFAFALARAAE